MAKRKTSEEVEVSEKVEEKKVEAEAFVYVGPTLFNEGLNNGTVFAGEFDNRLNALVEKYGISCLFVPVSKLGLAKQLIKKNGTIENIVFKKTLNKLGGK
ncbi:hypothetical protein [Cetobacterium sp. ZOR0034]|uniref:hypothetical protein n=1 Tax=Cetobacterium sp. ZOR0034 TaxID=1339239 RepID=UPI0006459071|nr:hypothetical protein [Cetobacterium sp. ZOR0034]